MPRFANTARPDELEKTITTRRSGQSALIVYDGASNSGDGLITAHFVANLLGHFGITPDMRPVASYNSGLIEQFDSIFICGMAQGSVIPTALLEDLAQSARPRCWINRHIGQLLADPRAATRVGFKFHDYLDDEEYSTITYRGIALPKSDGEINAVEITDPARVEVLATANDGKNSLPYALRSGSFWYFADSIFSYNTESDRSLVFADLLHDMLGQQHSVERRALVRIEDVSADSDPADLRRVADLLFARRIPFQVALIPIFKDPARRAELYLSDRPEVVEALHYMVARGGAIVLHGVTHQLHGASADDFEFWDTLAGRATTDSSFESVAHKIDAGLSECFRAGLYPIAWETPHYSASLAHYRSLAKIFSHVYERRMVTDDEGSQQYFPYEAEDWLGQSVIPENLGYVNGDDPDPEKIVEGADRLLAVRDPIASFFFHPYLASRYLETALDGIERDGYRFISAAQFGCKLALGDYAITTAPRSIGLTPRHRFLHRVALKAAQVSEQFEAVKPGSAITEELNPPAGGLVAIEGVTHSAEKQAAPTLIERLRIWWSGDDPRALPAPRSRARAAVLAVPSAAGTAEDARDVSSFKNFLSVYGIPFQCIAVRELEAAALSDDVVLFIPHCAAKELSDAEQQSLADRIERGGRAVIEGRSLLAESLGFNFSHHKFTVSQTSDLLFPDSQIAWQQPAEIERFTQPPVSTSLMVDPNTQTPIAVAARAGEGMVIYLAAEFDSQTGLGYARYPYLFEHLRERFRLSPPVRASGAEFYFDPGFREQAAIERLVASWQRDGIRAVYAAAWHFYPDWSFDYDRLIKLCHERGIAVYAWLELPQVSDKFWDQHPEWREKTVTGRDGEIAWRKMMNLANRDCREAALDFLSELLTAHDWDGVNIAELGFDTNGLADANSYVPMNADVRASFTGESGFDPRLLFDPSTPYYWEKNGEALAKWQAFRSRLVRDWLVAVLERVTEASHDRPLDIICTALDSLHNPSVTEKTGTDTRDVIALMSRYPFTLQVEDPAERWGDSPTRYREFGETYRKLVADPSRLMFDINVVRDRRRGAGPTALLSGTELALAALSAASAGNGRVAIYSEASLQAEDRAALPVVMGSASQITLQPSATKISASRTVRLSIADSSGRTGGPLNNEGAERGLPVVDGELWWCENGSELIVPAGEHQLGGAPREAKLTDRLGLSMQLKDITAEMRAAVRTEAGLAIDYSSPRRAWATVSREPRAVAIDDSTARPPLVKRVGSDWLVELPAGDHRVEIAYETKASVFVGIASVVSSESVVWLGRRFVFVLTGLYFSIRIRRFLERLAAFGNKRKKRKAGQDRVETSGSTEAAPRTLSKINLLPLQPRDEDVRQATPESHILEQATGEVDK